VRAAHLRLVEFCYYLDCGRRRDASDALNEAEAAALEAGTTIPSEFYGEFVFGKAFVQRDAEGTRQWWDRLLATKPKRLNADYWLARSAYLWMDGRMEEAREAWEKGNTLAHRLPKAGAYEFEREKYAMLRGELVTQRVQPRWHEDVGGDGGVAEMISALSEALVLSEA
jgi:tetratricopeptide (TPR) repeat protein